MGTDTVAKFYVTVHNTHIEGILNIAYFYCHWLSSAE